MSHGIFVKIYKSYYKKINYANKLIHSLVGLIFKSLKNKKYQWMLQRNFAMNRVGSNLRPMHLIPTSPKLNIQTSLSRSPSPQPRIQSPRYIQTSGGSNTRIPVPNPYRNPPTPSKSPNSPLKTQSKSLISSICFEGTQPFKQAQELRNRLDEMESKLQKEVSNNLTLQFDIKTLQKQNTMLHQTLTAKCKEVLQLKAQLLQSANVYESKIIESNSAVQMQSKTIEQLTYKIQEQSRQIRQREQIIQAIKAESKTMKQQLDQIVNHRVIEERMKLQEQINYYINKLSKFQQTKSLSSQSISLETRPCMNCAKLGKSVMALNQQLALARLGTHPLECLTKMTMSKNVI